MADRHLLQSVSRHHFAITGMDAPRHLKKPCVSLVNLSAKRKTLNRHEAASRLVLDLARS